MVRCNEHMYALEEALHLRLLKQCKPTSPFEVASMNERDAADVEEREQAQIIRISGAACKTLIDSERRKNTQASSDIGARQLARF